MSTQESELSRLYGLYCRFLRDAAQEGVELPPAASNESAFRHALCSMSELQQIEYVSMLQLGFKSATQEAVRAVIEREARGALDPQLAAYYESRNLDCV